MKNIASQLNRYPVSPGSICRYVQVRECPLCIVSPQILFPSEMFEARRWNVDSRFEAPMITLPNKARVFLESFVDVGDGYGKIKKFFIKVQLAIIIGRDNCMTNYCRKQLAFYQWRFRQSLLSTLTRDTTNLSLLPFQCLLKEFSKYMIMLLSIEQN